MSQDQSTKTDSLNRELSALRGSREFFLGSHLHQSTIFKLVRHIRLRHMRTQVTVLTRRNSNSHATDVCLLGVWYDVFPDGMPLELLERDLKKWEFIKHPEAPYDRALFTAKPDHISIYSNDLNLRLDFVMDEHSGMVQVEAHSKKITVDLYAPVKTVASIYPNRPDIEVVINAVDNEYSDSAPLTRNNIGVSKPVQFSGEHIKWLEKQQDNPRPLSLNHPEWYGVLAASKQLFDNVLTIPDSVDKERAIYYAHLVIAAGVPSITVQGFPRSYHQLVKAVRKLAPKLPIYAIYHGNFLHFREDYDWSAFKLIKSLYEDGDIARIGFVKKGMAEIFAAQAMRTAFIMNLVREIPQGPSIPLGSGQHIGLWVQPDWSWKKPPYAMLAALKLIPEACGDLFNASPRAKELAEMLNITVKIHPAAMPHTQTMIMLSKMHVNMYVSLTECAPMLPLESLSVGSPCLLGPTSHYFLDHRFLYEHLIVPSPDSTDVIAKYAKRALEERKAIIEAYREYAPDYNSRALKSLADFLEFPVQ